MGLWKTCRAGKFGWPLETLRLGMDLFPAPSLYFFLLPFMDGTGFET
jgi:hypothetical protein